MSHFSLRIRSRATYFVRCHEWVVSITGSWANSCAKEYCIGRNEPRSARSKLCCWYWANCTFILNSRGIQSVNWNCENWSIRMAFSLLHGNWAAMNQPITSKWLKMKIALDRQECLAADALSGLHGCAAQPMITYNYQICFSSANPPAAASAENFWKIQRQVFRLSDKTFSCISNFLPDSLTLHCERCRDYIHASDLFISSI